jgi:glycosyltransferase involved in cell wall biosynthesis
MHVLYSFPLRLGVTGIGAIAWQQVRGLIDAGARVTVVCGSCEKPLHGAARIIETMKLGGWSIPYRLLGHERAFERHDRLTARVVRESGMHFNIFHGWPLGSLQTLEACREHGALSFLERPNTHTGFAYRVVAEECKKLGLLLPDGHSHHASEARLAREEAEYAAADYLACPSAFVAKTFLDAGYGGDQLVIHQYGHDPATHSAAPARTRSADDGLQACFVASCEPRKGLHVALDAWLASSASKRGTLQVAGAFVPGYRELLASRLSHSSVREVGFVQNTAELMGKCDVMILPSIEEGSALVTYEARACGCVLVVSDATGARCTHLHDSLVHSAGNISELTNHLNMLAEDAGLLSRLREQSLKTTDELTWPHAAKVLMSHYQSALAGRRERLISVAAGA